MTLLQIILVSFFGAVALVSLGFMIAFIVEITVESKEDAVVEDDVFKAEESVEDMLANLDDQTNEEPEEAKEEEVENAPQEEVVEEEKTDDVLAGETQVIVINDNSNIDYEARLKQVTENKENLEKELAKINNSILKYDRTARRMERNQKMLDRRASELTNLNLVMYSVTDIKNVDEDKKVKQEELTAHIAELKASIQDAEEFLESNKEKNEHNVKMAEFLKKEIARYEDEIVEIKKILEEKAS